MFFTVRVEPGLADKLGGHGVVINGAPAERQGFGGMMSIGKSRAKVYVETDTRTTFRDIAGRRRGEVRAAGSGRLPAGFDVLRPARRRALDERFLLRQILAVLGRAQHH